MVSHKYITWRSGEHQSAAVQILKTKNGKFLPSSYGHVYKQFTLYNYKTKKACMAAAVKWRDAYLKENNLLYILDKGFDLRKKPKQHVSSNTSGVTGVYQFIYKGIISYQACWSTDTGQHKRSFSTLRYGDKEAFLMACEIRYFNSGILYVNDTKKLPCRPKVPYKVIK